MCAVQCRCCKAPRCMQARTCHKSGGLSCNYAALSIEHCLQVGSAIASTQHTALMIKHSQHFMHVRPFIVRHHWASGIAGKFDTAICSWSKRTGAYLWVCDDDNRFKLRDRLGYVSVLLLGRLCALTPKVATVRPPHPSVCVRLKLSCR